MQHARDTHSATLLFDGRVLVAGGGNGSTLAVESELFDPSTETWSLGPPLTQGRNSHTATRLLDGTVLVSGGATYNMWLSSAERYIPSTNQWAPAGTLAVRRQNHSAALLHDGRVLVVGGSTLTAMGADVTTSAAELFDPALNSWTSTGSLALRRQTAGIAVLPSGKVLVAGGLTGQSSGGYTVVSSAELYDPVTGTWSTAQSMLQPRNAHAMVTLPDGRVLVSGGVSDTSGTALSSAEVYSSETNQWVPAPSMANARYQHVSLVIGADCLVVAGLTSEGLVTTAELLREVGGWSSAGLHVGPRYNHAAVQVSGGRVLAIGGDVLEGGSISRSVTVEIAGVGDELFRNGFE